MGNNLKRIEKTTAMVRGVSYTVVRHFDEQGLLGRTVDSPCGCFGHPMRCCTTMYCPWKNKSKG